MPYNWILFDADGTIFDYDKAEHTALSQTFEQFGHVCDTAYLETYRRINGQIWRDFEDGKISQEHLKSQRFAQLFKALNITPAPDAHKFSDHYLNNLGNCAELIDGASCVLNALKGYVHLALITNGLKEVQRSRLAQSGLTDKFEAIIISDEVGVAKPHPGIFDIAFAAMGQPHKDTVLIVGDSLTSDMRGGYDYGIHTCWYNPQNKPTAQDIPLTHEIHTLNEVLRIIKDNP